MAVITTVLGPVFVDDQGPAGAPVALLWPSLFTDHRMWRHQTAALHAAGWRTLAVDPPGQGQSIGPGRRFTMDECAEAVVQILDSTKVDSPVAYLGTSWGGFVAPGSPCARQIGCAARYYSTPQPNEEIFASG